MTIIKSSQSFETDQKNTVQSKDICKFFAIPNSNVTFAKYFSVYSNMHPEARKELIRICATTIGLEHKRLLGKVDPTETEGVKISTTKIKSRNCITTIFCLYPGVFTLSKSDRANDNLFNGAIKQVS